MSSLVFIALPAFVRIPPAGSSISSAGQRQPLGEGEDTGEPGGGVMRQQLLRGQHDHREHAVQISAGHVASATTRASAGLSEFCLRATRRCFVGVSRFDLVPSLPCRLSTHNL